MLVKANTATASLDLNMAKKFLETSIVYFSDCYLCVHNYSEDDSSTGRC